MLDNGRSNCQSNKQPITTVLLDFDVLLKYAFVSPSDYLNTITYIDQQSSVHSFNISLSTVFIRQHLATSGSIWQHLAMHLRRGEGKMGGELLQLIKQREGKYLWKEAIKSRQEWGVEKLSLSRTEPCSSPVELSKPTQDQDGSVSTMAHAPLRKLKHRRGPAKSLLLLAVPLSLSISERWIHIHILLFSSVAVTKGWGVIFGVRGKRNV